jgi:hypothetical protein
VSIGEFEGCRLITEDTIQYHGTGDYGQKRWPEIYGLLTNASAPFCLYEKELQRVKQFLVDDCMCGFLRGACKAQKNREQISKQVDWILLCSLFALSPLPSSQVSSSWLHSWHGGSSSTTRNYTRIWKFI